MRHIPIDENIFVWMQKKAFFQRGSFDFSRQHTDKWHILVPMHDLKTGIIHHIEHQV